MLEKTLLSPLDCKDIRSVNPKGNQPWIFIGRTDAKAKALILWPPDVKSWLTGKDPNAGKDRRQEEKGTTEDEMVGWVASPTQWTWATEQLETMQISTHQSFSLNEDLLMSWFHLYLLVGDWWQKRAFTFSSTYLFTLYGLKTISFILWVITHYYNQIFPDSASGSLLMFPFLTCPSGSLSNSLSSGELRCFRLIFQGIFPCLTPGISCFSKKLQYQWRMLRN